MSHDWSYQSAVFAQGVKIFNLELYISNEGDMLTVNWTFQLVETQACPACTAIRAQTGMEAPSMCRDSRQSQSPNVEDGERGKS